MDNYDLLTAQSYTIHIYFFQGVARLQPAQQTHPGYVLGELTASRISRETVKVHGGQCTQKHLCYLGGHELLPNRPDLR